MAKWVKAYAADEQLFFRDYAAAHTKLSELGQVRREGRGGGEDWIPFGYVLAARCGGLDGEGERRKGRRWEGRRVGCRE